MDKEDIKRFSILVCQLKRKQLFRSMVNDFARISVGELTSDVLIGYEAVEEPTLPRRRRNAAQLSWNNPPPRS